MARTHNPFAAKERSKLETPWGVFEIASPNKTRLAQIDEISKTAQALADDDVLGIADMSMRSAAAGCENGDELLKHLRAAWDAGDVTYEQLLDMSQFVTSEITGGVAEGNA
jgi:hypothetical protein